MADEEQTNGQGEEAPKKSKLKLIIILVVTLLVLGGGGAAAYFFLFATPPEGEGEAGATESAVVETVRQPAIYTKVRTLEGKPMFVVTLQAEDGKTHYMQAYVEAKSRDQAVADTLTLHMPLVVARLNNLFATQYFEKLQTQEGKIALRQEATDLVREVMMERMGKPGVEAILFTNFVMQ